MGAAPFDKIVESKLLIGEGRDEVSFLSSFLKHLNISGIQVIDYGGKTKLKPFLITLPRIPGFANLTSLGITRDADENHAAAQDAIHSALAAATLPSALQVSVYVMPGEGTTGALEDLCLQTVSNPMVLKCIDSYFTCVHEAGHNPQLSVGNAGKARLQAWLAAQSNPGLRLGEAAQAGLIDWEAASLTPLRHLLESL